MVHPDCQCRSTRLSAVMGLSWNSSTRYTMILGHSHSGHTLNIFWIANPGETKLHSYCSVWCFKCGSRSLILLHCSPLRCDTVTTSKMLTLSFCSLVATTTCQQVGAAMLVFPPSFSPSLYFTVSFFPIVLSSNSVH